MKIHTTTVRRDRSDEYIKHAETLLEMAEKDLLDSDNAISEEGINRLRLKLERLRAVG